MSRLSLLFLLIANFVCAQVNYIAGSFASSSSSGTGSAGLPSLSYTPSAGVDRLLLLTLVYERDHSGAKGSNWANPKSVGGADPTVSFGAANLVRLRTNNYFQYSGANAASNATMTIEMIVYGVLEADIPAGLNSFVVSGINAPGHLGDEATMSVMMFENVTGVNYLGSGGCENCNNLSLAGLDPQDLDNMIISIGAVGSDRDFTEGAGYTMIGSSKLVTTAGTYNKFSEKDGIGMAAQYVTGTTALQTAPFSVSGAADVFGAVEVGFRLVATGVLPVELLYFEGYNEGEDNTLLWSTATEINNDRFEIQRSTNGLKWQTIALVSGQGDKIGETDYQFKDEQVNCKHCYYRLKQVDYDGKYEYSGTTLLKVEKKGKLKLYPNPAENQVTITSSFEGGTISVHSVTGAQMIFMQQSGKAVDVIDISQLSRGHYYIVLSFKDQIQTKQLVKL